jgi:hypothetical protein
MANKLLYDLVLRAMDERQHKAADALSIELALKGDDHRKGVQLAGAYRKVAADILNCMERDGVLTRDDLGWYVRRGEK